jgi:hypothetical protein
MDEIQAEKMAEILGGEAWQSGGDIWLVLIRRNDGHLVVISDEVVCEYENEDAFEENRASRSILLIS